MPIAFPTLDWILERRTEAPTPIILKVATIVQGIFLISQTIPPDFNHLQALVYFALWWVEAAILIALWKMKRWPVLILATYALVHALTAMPRYFAKTPHTIGVAVVFAVIILAFHNIALISAAPFWRRMTWK